MTRSIAADDIGIRYEGRTFKISRPYALAFGTGDDSRYAVILGNQDPIPAYTRLGSYLTKNAVLVFDQDDRDGFSVAFVGIKPSDIDRLSSKELIFYCEEKTGQQFNLDKIKPLEKENDYLPR